MTCGRGRPIPGRPTVATVSRTSFDRMGLVSAAMAWVAVGIAQWAGVGETRDDLAGLWWGCYVAFGVVYVVGVLIEVHDPRVGLWMAGAQCALAVSMVALGAFTGVSGVILVLSSVTLSAAFPARWAIVGIVVQTLLGLIFAMALFPAASQVQNLVVVLSFLAFQFFAFLMVRSLRETEQASLQIAAAHHELQLAQARLAESSRAQERLRISRDLHDALGHQLTALAVHLEVASRTVLGPGAEEVEIARTTAKDLLGEVREVVGRLREAPPDLGVALQELARPITAPEVVLQVDDDVQVIDPARREAILRCAQEAVTNAVRHSGATHLWLSVEQLGTAVTVTARDDGRGSTTTTPGNGLLGMVERFADLGGEVTWHSVPGRGFTLEASLPVSP